ncbi:MAG: hypothetical protein WKG06_09015 [Segetibacter sp.]
MNIPKKILTRQHEITANFLKELDKHLFDIVEERATEMFELRRLCKHFTPSPNAFNQHGKTNNGKSSLYVF